METEYVDAMREHLGTLGEELDLLHQAAIAPEGLNALLYRAAERNLQLVTEACIGIAKQRLKSQGMVVPSDARQAFAKLQRQGQDNSGTPWNKVIGLRDALVHDYLNLDPSIVKGIIRQGDYLSLLEFAEAWNIHEAGLTTKIADSLYSRINALRKDHDSRGPSATGERLSPWIPSCSGSIRVELDGQRTTTRDNGALLLRKALDNSGVIAALGLTWSTSAIWIASGTAWPVNAG